MKIYTVKDKEGNLYPKALLEVPNVSDAVRNGEIVQVDYGLETVLEYLKKHDDMELAICSLEEVL